MSERILVTGATGKIGRQVVEQLAALGVSVRAALRTVSDNPFGAYPTVEPFAMDFSAPQSFAAALKDIGKAFVLTPVGPEAAAYVEHFVAAAQPAGVRHLVRLSVYGTRREPTITFSRLHRQAEEVIEASGIPWTFLRPNFFMQNFLAQRTIKSQGVFYDPAAEGKVSFVDVRDIAAMAVAALTQDGHAGKAYDLTGPEALANTDIAALLTAITGKTVRYVSISDDDLRRTMRAAGATEWHIEGVVDLARIQRDGYTAEVAHDIEQVTGRKPIAFAQFVHDHLDAFR